VSASSTSISVPRPTGAATGDLLLASISLRGNASVTAPAGWTLVRVDLNGSTMRLVTFRKWTVAGEPASYAFTFSKSTTSAAAGMVAYRGVDPTTPVDAHAGQINSSSATRATAPSVATTVAGVTLVSVFGSASDVTATSPAGMAERYDRQSTGSKRTAVAGDDQTLGAAGSSGVRTATLSKSTSSIGQQIALRPGP
jgi:hypothetical protein